MDSTINLHEAAGKVRSRRALMVGALGGLGAWATSAVGRRVSPAEAATGDPLLLGEENDAGELGTELRSASAAPVLFVLQNGGDGAGISVFNGGLGAPAILATSNTGRAIEASVGSSESSAEVITARAINGIAISASSRDKHAIVGSSVSKHGVQGKSENGAGVYAVSTNGDGLVARHRTGPGWAGRFHGDVLIQGNCTLKERPSTPAAPTADRAQLFLRDNGSGKSELCVQFATGPVQVLATEP